MKRNKKLQLIKQIKNDTTISKITRRKLRKKLMSGMQAGLEEVGKYVIRINYLNSDKNKPYVSIWKRNDYYRIANMNAERIKEENQQKAVQELEEKYLTD